MNEIEQLGNYPNYSIQLDKGECKVELLGNDLPLWKAFERGGFSSLIPFNLNILNNGTQSLKIKIHPDEGKQYLDEYTRVSVQVIYFDDDKNVNSPRKVIHIFDIAKEIEGKIYPILKKKYLLMQKSLGITAIFWIMLKIYRQCKTG